jgi:cellulose synthase/poly-beta-1,6-N-acetylglucosamine synthase-like glycosyltransferase
LAEGPAVTVVIPVLDGARVIGEAIESALAQDYEGPLDVVVAVGSSRDETGAIVDSYAESDPRVQSVPNGPGSTPAGLNAAIRAASGSVIVRCDAQARLPSGYVRRAVALLAETGAVNVGGVQAAEGTSFLQRAIALAQTTSLGVGDARYRTGGAPGPVDTVYLGVFRREALDLVGGFDETMLRNQDYELNWRLREAGGVVYFHPDLRVAYRPRSSLRSLARQYFQYGTWKRVMLRRHPGSLRWRQLVPPALLVGLLGSVVAAFTPWPLLGVIVPGTYAAVLLGAAAATLVRRREPAAVLLPVVLPTIHLSWSIGLLFGRARLPPR